VVPTLNSGLLVDACLRSVANQTYPLVELIVVDGFSSDDTVGRAQAYTEKVFAYGPSQAHGRVFGAPLQRNFGVSRATGDFVYYVDVDMILPPNLLEDCVTRLDATGADALIIPERSFGIGFWAEVKAIERASYIGNDLVEAPRLVRREVWLALGGIDTEIGGGGDDWDLHIRLRDRGFTIARVDTCVLHNEGRLTLRRLASKRYMYGRSVTSFLKRHGLVRSVRHFSPFRKGLLSSAVLASGPRRALGLLAMRTVEYAAGGFGMVVGVLGGLLGMR
jgi:glycosyltransferase involved in cell wall biosynthesis